MTMNGIRSRQKTVCSPLQQTAGTTGEPDKLSHLVLQWAGQPLNDQRERETQSQSRLVVVSLEGGQEEVRKRV